MEDKLNYDSVEPTDSNIEQIAPKSRGRPRKKPVKEKDPNKPKRIQSEQQKQNFIKCLEARKRSIEIKRKQKAEQSHNIPLV